MTTTIAPPTTCPTCGSANHRAVLHANRHGQFSIDLCRNCGLAFALPRPTAQELEHFYSSTYFKKDAAASIGYADYRGIAEANARNMWHELRTDPLMKTLPDKTILDVGCATGGFLIGAAADGYDAIGVELSSDAVAVARNEFHLNVIHGDINAPELANKKFALVTMWHVLEHVLDPLDTLQRAANLLKPGGVLLIELPNWNSLGRIIRGEKWGALTPPEHINFFSPKSLRAAVASTGLTKINVDTRYPHLVNRAKESGRKSVKRMLAAGAGLLACAAGYGGYVRLTARKA